MKNTSIVDRVSLIYESKWLYATTLVINWKKNKSLNEKFLLREFDKYFRTVVRKLGKCDGLEINGCNYIFSVSTLEYRPSDDLIHVHGMYGPLYSPKSMKEVYGIDDFAFCILQSSNDLQDRFNNSIITLYGTPYNIVRGWVKPYEANDYAYLKYITEKSNEFFLSSNTMKWIKKYQKDKDKTEKLLKQFERMYENE